MSDSIVHSSKPKKTIDYNEILKAFWASNSRPNVYEPTIFHGFCECCSKVSVPKFKKKKEKGEAKS